MLPMSRQARRACAQGAARQQPYAPEPPALRAAPAGPPPPRRLARAAPAAHHRLAALLVGAQHALHDPVNDLLHPGLVPACRNPTWGSMGAKALSQEQGALCAQNGSSPARRSVRRGCTPSARLARRACRAARCLCCRALHGRSLCCSRLVALQPAMPRQSASGARRGVLTELEQHALHAVDADGQLVGVLLRPGEGQLAGRRLLDEGLGALARLLGRRCGAHAERVAAGRPARVRGPPGPCAISSAVWP